MISSCCRNLKKKRQERKIPVYLLYIPPPIPCTTFIPIYICSFHFQSAFISLQRSETKLERARRRSVKRRGAKMLAIFHKTLGHAPNELNSPDSKLSSRKAKNPDEILKDFHSAHSDKCFSANFSAGASIACVTAERQISSRRRLLCSFDDVYCMFLGSLDNLSSLVKQYGLSFKTNEALLVIEAYRTLRDRGPYPADQVIKDLDGSYAFVVYDGKAGTIFCATSADGVIPLHWGIAADGSVVFSNELETVKESCGKSFAPFPTGCMFHSQGGLRSFEHPMNRMKAMPRVDSEGVMCGANFKVDYYSRINSMPRVGSSANWTSWDDGRI